MEMDDVVALVSGLDGVLVLAPQEGDGTPEIAWGDAFFYYAPDGVLPQGQPFATVVTKDYPDDATSRLDRPGAYRVNVHASAAERAQHTGSTAPPAESTSEPADDTVVPHPTYAAQGWLAVTNPGPRTEALVGDLLRAAHARARARAERRG